MSARSSEHNQPQRRNGVAMPIHYALDYSCSIKHRVGGNRSLMSQLRLRSTINETLAEAKRREFPTAGHGAIQIRWYRRDDPALDVAPDAPVPVGRWKAGTITAAREHLVTNLDDLATQHCLGCLGNGAIREKNGKRPHPDSENPRGFGCIESLALPISEAAEDYFRLLLDESLKRSHAGQHDLRSLLVELLRPAECGQSVAMLRQSVAGPRVLARRRPLEVKRGFFRRVRLSTDQVFEVGLFVPRLSEGMCLFLAGFSGGIRVRDLPAEAVSEFVPPRDVPWMLIRRDEPAPRTVLWTFELPELPAELAADTGVNEMRRFFAACFHAYSLGCGLVIEPILEIDEHSPTAATDFAADTD